jgi:hypothetical protein
MNVSSTPVLSPSDHTGQAKVIDSEVFLHRSRSGRCPTDRPQPSHTYCTAHSFYGSNLYTQPLRCSLGGPFHLISNCQVTSAKEHHFTALHQPQTTQPQHASRQHAQIFLFLEACKGVDWYDDCCKLLSSCYQVYKSDGKAPYCTTFLSCCSISCICPVVAGSSYAYTMG